MNNTTPNKTNPNHHFNSTSNQNSSWSWMPNQEESPTSINEEVVSRGAELNKSFDSATAGNSSSKRGRPKSELLTTLMIQGSTSPSAIKCKFCNRVFPRDKSLSAHLRTHTGERPFHCTFPLCSRAFTQSGQLKTHQRLHTGERPFSCSAPHCQMRFTHANRHCPDHPYEALRRSDDEFLLNAQPEEQSTEIIKWLQKYREERQHQLLQQQQQQQNQSPSTSSSSSSANAASSRKTPKRPSSSSSSSSLPSNSAKSNDENKRRMFSKSIVHIRAQENCDTPSSKEYASMSPSKQARKGKGFMCEMDMNAGQAEYNIIQSSTPIQNQQQQQQSQQYLISESSTPDIAALMGSPISTNKPKYCRPKIILWKEPIDDNDDEPLNSENELQKNESMSANVLCTSAPSPVKKSFNPKKKWLREACQDLGTQPLDFNTNHPLFSRNEAITADTSNLCANQLSQASNNIMRPSVIIMAKDKGKD